MMELKHFEASNDSCGCHLIAGHMVQVNLVTAVTWTEACSCSAT